MISKQKREKKRENNEYQQRILTTQRPPQGAPLEAVEAAVRRWQTPTSVRVAAAEAQAADLAAQLATAQAELARLNEAQRQVRHAVPYVRVCTPWQTTRDCFNGLPSVV